MNKKFTSYTIVSRSKSSSVDENLLNGLKVSNPTAFFSLYDRYAPLLLGVINKIVNNRDDAVTLLETTFRKVHNQFNEFQAQKQPLFIWLLKIARCTALDILEERKTAKSFTLQINTSGQVVALPAVSNHTVISGETSIKLADAQLKVLLDKILFENYTPEEAASLLGIPVSLVRQQLRLAMHQLRASQKA